MNQDDETNLNFVPRENDRRQTKTRAVGNDKFFMRKVGDRLITGVERRKCSDRRNELIDTTHVTLWEENIDGTRYKIL